MIHADSEANARVKAALKGIVVTSVEADASDHSAASAAGHRRGSTQRPPIKRWALIIAGAAAGAVTLAIFVGLVATLVDDGAIPSDQLFAQSSPAVVRVVVKDGEMQTTGQGSGFFISSNGLLVTNFHVIEDAHFASVLLANNATFFVEGVAATDQDNDLALLKINGTELPFLLLDKGDPPKVGTRVYAIGNPQGLTNTFSEGLVSAIRADEDQVRRIIQTTAAISPGSSGGPLIGPDGKVVGVTTAYLGGGQNLNFAVPTSHVNVLVANKGEIVSLASADAKPLDSHATDELNKVWTAINENAFGKALSLLATLRRSYRMAPTTGIQRAISTLRWAIMIWRSVPTSPPSRCG